MANRDRVFSGARCGVVPKSPLKLLAMEVDGDCHFIRKGQGYFYHATVARRRRGAGVNNQGARARPFTDNSAFQAYDIVDEVP